MGNVILNCLDELADTVEHASADALVGDFHKPSFHQVEPRGRGGDEVEMKARMFEKPRLNVGMFVRTVVVDDAVDVFILLGGVVNLPQKLEEFLMAVSGHAFPDHYALEHIECGEECCCSVALVVMRHGSRSSLLEGQGRLGAVERLDLAFLINAEEKRMLWWTQVQTDNILEFFNEALVIAEFKGPH